MVTDYSSVRYAVLGGCAGALGAVDLCRYGLWRQAHLDVPHSRHAHLSLYRPDLHRCQTTCLLATKKWSPLKV